jgi:protein gp37
MGEPPGFAPRRQLALGRDAGNGRIGRARSEDADWFDATWNPTAGCSLCSPGCDQCYAMRIAAGLARMGGKTGARYEGLTTTGRSGPVWTGEIRVAEDLLAWPLLRRRSQRIAVNLMSDLFQEKLATATIDLLHAVMKAAHWHQFLVLTKRATRMRDYYGDPETPRRIVEKADFPASLIAPRRGRRRRSIDQAEPRARPTDPINWPLPNLWLGVSVENQNWITRVGDLLQTPAAIRWVCFEPLLDQVRPEAVPVADGYFDAFRGGHYTIDGRGRAAPVEGPAWQPLDWVVSGGEIGAGARPTHPRWLRELRDMCVSTGRPFFFRQWGEWAPVSNDRAEQTMTRVGKRTAGRLLDGRTWDEIPATSRS